ncbi:hypothetical protein DWW31_14025 [Clostridium sp. AF15-17LB]|nr:hypothetical protein DWW31_14025 [Clostridium sp. AF15-17LB]
MKIGELQEHCGECPLIDYCTDPYETPKLCAIDSLRDVSTNTYRELAEKATATEIQSKLYQYMKFGTEYTDESMGAICDIVLEKMKQINI